MFDSTQSQVSAIPYLQVNLAQKWIARRQSIITRSRKHLRPRSGDVTLDAIAAGKNHLFVGCSVFFTKFSLKLHRLFIKYATEWTFQAYLFQDFYFVLLPPHLIHSLSFFVFSADFVGIGLVARARLRWWMSLIQVLQMKCLNTNKHRLNVKLDSATLPHRLTQQLFALHC